MYDIRCSTSTDFHALTVPQVSTCAEEALDPGRGLPIGIVGSLGIITVLYVLM